MNNKIDYWWLFLLMSFAVLVWTPARQPILDQIKESCGPRQEVPADEQ